MRLLAPSPIRQHCRPMAQLLEPPTTDAPPEIRRAPPPLHGGLPTLLRFMRRHRMLNFKYVRLIRLQGIYKRDVDIGNNVWIGYGACILRGVTVGDNAIIGTNSVVTRDVPANAVVAGLPAKIIRMRPAPRRMRFE